MSLVVCALAAPETLGERRVALLVGANTGWSMDRPLRHALEDAERVAAALTELGGFSAADVKLLEDPTTEALTQALDQLGGLADVGLLVFFYSGHADQKHLHLRGAPLSFEELYRRLRDLPVKVKLGVLDACRSGSILAAKGAQRTALFEVKVQEELEVRGVALLTSSGADELSQEARALRGSFFSHHLVSGLRGAADENGDGRVSLGEAYAYAAARTTLDTAATPAGPQRPEFRYELKGRGELVLTRLENPSSGVLAFAPTSRRCWVTDLAERRLVAEVPPGGPGAQLALPAGDYLLKCLEAESYLVAAASVAAGARVEAARLSFKGQPLADGVLKGAGETAAENPLAPLKRRGFQELRDDRPDDALRTFDEVLSRNLRDAEGYRGKAQAYLAFSERARVAGRSEEAERWMKAALRTDPRLEEDPSVKPRVAAVAVLHQERPEELAKKNLEGNYPRRYQRFGVGLSLTDAHGPLSISFGYLLHRQWQATVHLSPLVLGGGVSARFVPRDGRWSPFVGAGANATLARLGVLDGPQTTISFEQTVVAQRSTYDFVAYFEAGLQAASRHWQADAGVAVGYGAPVGDAEFIGVFPVLSFKYFF